MYTFVQMKYQTNQHFYPLFCGYQTCDPSYSFGPAVRDYHLLHFCISGKGQFFSNDICYDICEGQGFLISPKQLTFYQADAVHPWTYLWIAFEGDMVKKYLSLCGLSINTPIIQCPQKDRLQQIILDMIAHGSATISNELYNQGLLYQFFSLLAQSPSLASRPEENIDNQYIAKAIEYIRFNYQAQITVQDIADYVSLNRSYLTTVFQKNLHFSPQQFLMRHRITKATEMLVETDHLIQNIASSCGYANELSFAKAFKKVTGLSPSEYRKKKRIPPNTIRREDPHKDESF